MLTNFVSTDALLLKVNLVSIGVLMIIVGHMNGALGDIGPNFGDPTLPPVSLKCLYINRTFVLETI